LRGGGDEQEKKNFTRKRTGKRGKKEKIAGRGGKGEPRSTQTLDTGKGSRITKRIRKKRKEKKNSSVRNSVIGRKRDQEKKKNIIKETYRKPRSDGGKKSKWGLQPFRP